MPNTQAGQFISVTTPLGDDVLLLQKFTGQEGISQLFNFQLDLASQKPPIKLEVHHWTKRYGEHDAERRQHALFQRICEPVCSDRSGFSVHLLSGRDRAVALVLESDIGLSNFSE